LRSNAFPSYDEVKILWNNSGVGMVVVVEQAIGYIYGIVVQWVQGL